jgi:LmbE family N-acetylglucosaminyl deacetylase
VIVAVSPHLDDAVFSLGAALGRWAAEGAEVVVLTVFTASVAAPAGFALACQLDKGLPADADYLALRRAEDHEAARRLALTGVVHLPLPEAPHRGYDSAPALFAGLHPDDPGPGQAAEALGAALAELRPVRVVTCRGVGGHVDHLAVIAALDALGVGAERWRDLPYGLRPEAPAPGPDDAAVRLGRDDLERKLHACAAYATQLGFQFGGEAAMRAALGGTTERLGPAG